MNEIGDFHHSRRRRSTRSKIGDALLTAGVIMGVTSLAKSMKEPKTEQPTADVKFCSECGTKNEGSASFCAECGHKFVEIDN